MTTEESRWGQSVLGHGHFTNGQWYCECHRVAYCRTQQSGKPYAGEKCALRLILSFNSRRADSHTDWRCPKVNNQQCSFFLWVAHESAAKEWWTASHLPPVPQTPKKGGAASDMAELPRTMETPFTKAKRKLVLVDLKKNENNEDQNNRNLDDNPISVQPRTALDDPFTDSRPLSESARKVAKKSTKSTPGQPFIEKLRGPPTILQTPTSKDYKPISSMSAAPQTVQTPNTSPSRRYNNRIDINTTKEPDPTTTVLKLLRSENITLKASTEAQLRHVIQLKIDIEETKLRRSEQTILSLSERVDELEMMVLNLT